MTFEELKAEAKRQGYNLIKKKESIKLLPCTCGNKRPEIWFNYDGGYYRCQKCGNTGIVASSKNAAKRNWNDAEWRQTNEH